LVLVAGIRGIDGRAEEDSGFVRRSTERHQKAERKAVVKEERKSDPSQMVTSRLDYDHIFPVLEDLFLLIAVHIGQENSL
jgi:hypothetical protein